MQTSDGIADIGYTHAFYPEMAPAQLAFALLLAGFRPPVDAGQPFSYGELGCGQGLTSNLCAALHPEGRFFANDLLPAHIEGAADLAAEAGSVNASFVCQSFADTPAQRFDIIALHGVWTWVGNDDRARLVDIVRSHLAPGGLLYVSYNALPGWVPDMPVRQMLLDLVVAADGPLPQRIEAALARLHDTDLPAGSRALVDSLAGKTAAYIAHEYLNCNWTPFHPADVAASLEPAGLSFATSATLLDHVDGLAADAASTRFRRDLFLASPGRLTAEQRIERLRAMRFGLLVPRDRIPESVAGPSGAVVDLDPRLYGPLVERLEAGPCPVAELGTDTEAVVQALALLTALGLTAPLAAVDAQRVARFNAAVLRRNRRGGELRQLIAPALGAGVQLDQPDRLFLLAEMDGDDPVALATTVLGCSIDQAQRMHAIFTSRRRPWLARLGF